VLAGIKIVAAPAGTQTAEHDPDDYGAERLVCYVTNIVPGVGFDICATVDGASFGTYVINFIGV